MNQWNDRIMEKENMIRSLCNNICELWLDDNLLFNVEMEPLYGWWKVKFFYCEPENIVKGKISERMYCVTIDYADDPLTILDKIKSAACRVVKKPMSTTIHSTNESTRRFAEKMFKNDAPLNESTKKILYEALNVDDIPEIKEVIYNKPATIIFWKDGSKTVVKCDNECYDKEKGFVMAFMKKILGNKGNYYNLVKKWVPECEEAEDYTCTLSDIITDMLMAGVSKKTIKDMVKESIRIMEENKNGSNNN